MLRILLYFQITWHPVSKAVGNVKNKEAHLCFKVELDDAGLGMSETEKKSKNFMANWLSKAETTKRKSRDFDEKNDQDNKREKK